MKKELPKVILADPPWVRGQSGQTKGAEKYYPLMGTERIANMPVSDLAASDASLFLWAIPGAIEDALFVMRRWGFTYKSQAIWDKYYLGLGHWFRFNHELLLYGERGKPQPWKYRGQRSVLPYPRMEHSVKPAEQFALIERVLDGPYLELFARRRPNTRADWRVWGNEVDSDIVIPGYPVPSDRRHPGEEVT